MPTTLSLLIRVLNALIALFIAASVLKRQRSGDIDAAAWLKASAICAPITSSGQAARHCWLRNANTVGIGSPEAAPVEPMATVNRPRWGNWAAADAPVNRQAGAAVGAAQVCHHGLPGAKERSSALCEQQCFSQSTSSFFYERKIRKRLG